MVPKTEYMYKHINIIQASNTDIFHPILNIYIYRYVCIDIDVYCNLVLFFSDREVLEELTLQLEASQKIEEGLRGTYNQSQGT